MTCPKCNNAVEPTADQLAAMLAVGVSFPVMAAPYIATMIVMPYLAPFFLGGLLWTALRKAKCPSCGHPFTSFQEGKK